MKKVWVTILALFSMGCAQNANQQVVKQVIKQPPIAKKQPPIEKKQPVVADVNSISEEEIIDNTPILKKSPIVTIQATGEGVSPINALSVPQAKVMARRAAIADAYRALAEKMYGIRIKGKETIKDLMLKNSEIKTYVYGIIRGASIEEESFKDGIYRVIMNVKLDIRKWNKFINNN